MSPPTFVPLSPNFCWAFLCVCVCFEVLFIQSEKHD